MASSPTCDNSLITSGDNFGDVLDGLGNRTQCLQDGVGRHGAQSSAEERWSCGTAASPDNRGVAYVSGAVSTSHPSAARRGGVWKGRGGAARGERAEAPLTVVARDAYRPGLTVSPNIPAVIAVREECGVRNAAHQGGWGPHRGARGGARSGTLRHERPSGGGPSGALRSGPTTAAALLLGPGSAAANESASPPTVT